MPLELRGRLGSAAAERDRLGAPVGVVAQFELRARHTRGFRDEAHVHDACFTWGEARFRAAIGADFERLRVGAGELRVAFDDECRRAVVFDGERRCVRCLPDLDFAEGEAAFAEVHFGLSAAVGDHHRVFDGGARAAIPEHHLPGVDLFGGGAIAVGDGELRFVGLGFFVHVGDFGFARRRLRAIAEFPFVGGDRAEGRGRGGRVEFGRAAWRRGRVAERGSGSLIGLDGDGAGVGEHLVARRHVDRRPGGFVGEIDRHERAGQFRHVCSLAVRGERQADRGCFLPVEDRRLRFAIEQVDRLDRRVVGVCGVLLHRDICGQAVGSHRDRAGVRDVGQGDRCFGFVVGEVDRRHRLRALVEDVRGQPVGCDRDRHRRRSDGDRSFGFVVGEVDRGDRAFRPRGAADDVRGRAVRRDRDRVRIGDRDFAADDLAGQRHRDEAAVRGLVVDHVGRRAVGRDRDRPRVFDRRDPGADFFFRHLRLHQETVFSAVALLVGDVRAGAVGGERNGPRIGHREAALEGVGGGVERLQAAEAFSLAGVGDVGGQICGAGHGGGAGGADEQHQENRHRDPSAFFCEAQSCPCRPLGTQGYPKGELVRHACFCAGAPGRHWHEARL